MIDIGNIIKDYCKHNNISVITLAKQIRLSPSTLYANLNNNSMSLARLDQISRTLNHNFFIHFIENTNSTEEQLLRFSTENKEFTTKVANLQKENLLLQEIISLLKARQ